MKIGILGGSFNPPHLGHVLVASQALELSNIEKVWLLPCFRHTFNKTLSHAFNRVAMTKMLEDKNVSVSTLEVDHELDGNTINLVPILKKQFPNDSFTFIIGSDQLESFTKWGSWKVLLQELSFLVVPRGRQKTDSLYKGMKILSHPLFVSTNISSSNIRQRVKKGHTITHLVPKRVEEYIIEKKLYGASSIPNF